MSLLSWWIQCLSSEPGVQLCPLSRGTAREGHSLPRIQEQGRCVWGASEAAEESLQLEGGGWRVGCLHVASQTWPAKRSFLLSKRSFLLTILQLLFDLNCTFSWKTSSILSAAMKLLFSSLFRPYPSNLGKTLKW